MRINLIAPALTVVLVPSIAAAQTQASNDTWAGNIGIATAAMPTYMGSNQYKVVAVPIISVEYKERAFLGAASNGIGAGAGVYLVRRTN
jgi:outer membrane scaffolding protein for murein synthesis (MipA/OmpV family)